MIIISVQFLYKVMRLYRPVFILWGHDTGNEFLRDGETRLPCIVSLFFSADALVLNINR